MAVPVVQTAGIINLSCLLPKPAAIMALVLPLNLVVLQEMR